MREETRENLDLTVPITGGPKMAEFRVEGFVELFFDVSVVGGVSGSDANTWICCSCNCCGVGGFERE